MTWDLWHGDNREMLASIEDNSLDSLVSDPPYELGFMGKGWDNSGIAFDVAFWKETYRVLKPGAHLVCFGAPRLYHRLAVAIEDAGFELRDSLMWMFGTGFPKSMDISKAIDKAAGAEREVVGSKLGQPGYHLNACAGGEAFGEGFTSKTPEQREKECQITAPSTDAAKQWDGWGTALKPAYEPIILARKPCSEPTVAANVLRWGVGGINIEASRVGWGDETPSQEEWNRLGSSGKAGGDGRIGQVSEGQKGAYAQGLIKVPTSRFPANVLHDGSDEVLAAFPDAKGQQGGLTGNEPSLRAGGSDQNCYGVMDRRHTSTPRVETETSAARFFKSCPYTDEEQFHRFHYSSKATKKELEGSKHPTVKPIALMRYLSRLITPPGGTILDPFAGSGTTGEAALLEGFNVILAEREDEYVKDIERRMARVEASL